MDTVSGYSKQSKAVRRAQCASRTWHRIVLLTAVVGLAACTDTSNLQPAPAEPVVLGPSAPLPPYRIQVGDVLDLRLLLNPELNEEVTVRPDGHISTTIAGDVVATGRTIPELDAALRSDYAHDLQNPRISVVVKSFAPTRIYVAGEVNNPGEFITVGPTLTLSQAIARAGGLKLSSSDPNIFVIRREANDQPEFLSVRFNDIEFAKDPTADVRLAAYDVVYVPKMGVAEVYKFYNQYVAQFVNPSFGFSYIVNPAAAAGTVITH